MNTACRNRSWEYASCAGTMGTWHFGEDESQLADHAWYTTNSGGGTHTVGEKQANPQGLYDIDWRGDYPNSPGVATAGSTGLSSS